MMALAKREVAELIADYQTMGALHDLVHAPPSDVDPHSALMAARGLSLSMLRRLRDLPTGPVVRIGALDATV